MPKCSILASFWKLEACGQTVLPDRSDLVGQKLMEMPKLKYLNKWDILGDFQTFQTMCTCFTYITALGCVIIWTSIAQTTR